MTKVGLMARKIVHQIVDDIDGSVLEVGEGDTILFSLDGTAYEIDLSADHAAELRAALAPYVSAGRRVSGSGRTASSGSSSRARRTTSDRDYSAIRTWAKANGHEVSGRGRVPATVLEAYDAAH
jgi:hypothetical protein